MAVGVGQARELGQPVLAAAALINQSTDQSNLFIYLLLFIYLFIFI